MDKLLLENVYNLFPPKFTLYKHLHNYNNSLTVGGEQVQMA